MTREVRGPTPLPAPCPVCASPITAFVRDVLTVRTHRWIPLYVCIECRSFWNPSGYVESEQQLRRDVEWGLRVADRNTAAAPRLFDHLAGLGVSPTRMVEIGCGIGTLLTAATERGIEAIGFDVNGIAVAHARSIGLDARAELWTSETPLPGVDLFLAISVLEHLEQPRPLLGELCASARSHAAALFVSVPFLSPERWRFLIDVDPKVPGTPFFDNDVHVTHFSWEGLESALRGYGMENLTKVKIGLWHGVLARAS